MNTWCYIYNEDNAIADKYVKIALKLLRYKEEIVHRKNTRLFNCPH